MREIGRLSAEKMIAILSKRLVPEKQTVVPMELIIRESCGNSSSG
ncbi:hypothetical protein AB6A23_13830 [Paenibacillus tarimensis]